MLMAMPKLGREGKKRKFENAEQIGMTSQICMEVCTSREWARDEEFAFQRDYLTAKPSPHLWKKVLKMVILYILWSLPSPFDNIILQA